MLILSAKSKLYLKTSKGCRKKIIFLPLFRLENGMLLLNIKKAKRNNITYSVDDGAGGGGPGPSEILVRVPLKYK